jgi:hypothetical protein
MTATTIPATSLHTAVDSRRMPVWRVAAGAGVLAAAAAELTALVARLAGVPMEAGGAGADRAEPIPPLGFATMTLFFAAAGLVLAVVLARRATHAARIYAVVTTVVVAVSLLGPVSAGATTTATKVVLALTHVVAGAVAIPLVARRLSRR